MDKIADAIDHLDSGKAKGKIVIKIASE